MKLIFNRNAKLVAVMSFIHVCVLSVLKFFPFPEFFIYSYLTKMGLVPYTQIIDQHFPGLVFFPINFATLGIDSVLGYRIVSYILVILSHIAIYKITKKVIKNSRFVIFPNLLFLIWHPFLEGYVLWIDSFAQTSLLCAFYFFLGNVKRNQFLGGLMLGLTLLLKQTAAPLIGIYLLFRFVSTKDKKVLLPVLAGFTLCIGFLFLWVFVKDNWGDFYYWTFIFNITIFAEMGRKLPQLSELVKIAPIILSPLVTFLLLLYKIKPSRTLISLFIFYVGSLFFSFARFDYVHLQPALPFAILIFVFVLSIISSERRYFSKLILFFTAFSVLFNIYLLRPYVGKNTYFFGEHESELTEKVNFYRAGQKVFAFGTTPHIYYMTNTLPPGNVFVFQFPWFSKIAEQKILKGIIIDPPSVVIRDPNAEVGGMNLIDYMPNIKLYINRYYKVVDEVDGTEIMTRN